MADFEPIKPNLSASNGETVRKLALAGNRIACLSGFMVKQDIADGRLIPLLEQGKVTNTGREPIMVVYYKSSTLLGVSRILSSLIAPRRSF